MNPEYHNYIDTVPIGEKYESVTIEQGTINLGDILVWEDPDAGHDDETVTISLYVAPIEAIYRFTGKNDDREAQLEFGIPAGVGRIDMRYICAISGKEIQYQQSGHKCDVKFIDRFLSSDYDRYMNIEWTRSSDCRVSGE